VIDGALHIRIQEIDTAYKELCLQIITYETFEKILCIQEGSATELLQQPSNIQLNGAYLHIERAETLTLGKSLASTTSSATLVSTNPLP
jgi:hypothetical protein